MTTTLKALYGTSNQTITITLAGLTNNGQRESTAVDNTSNLFLDALVQLKIKTGSSGTTGYINVYAYGSADGGTSYSDGATGTDAGITLTVPPNVRLIGVINTPANSTTYKSSPMSVANAFGGVLPDHWGLVVENKSGATLDGNESTHAKFYQGIQVQGV